MALAMAQQNGDVVRGLEERQHVLRGVERFGSGFLKIRSWLPLTAPIDRVESVLVDVGIVPKDFDDLRDKTPAGSPFELDNHVHGIADVGLDRSVGQFDPALQDATGEPCEPLFGGFAWMVDNLPE